MEGTPMRDETIPEQLRRVDDLIDEAISIIGDLREENKADRRFARAEAHARAAQRDIRIGLGGTPGGNGCRLIVWHFACLADRPAVIDGGCSLPGSDSLLRGLVPICNRWRLAVSQNARANERPLL